MNFKVVLEKVLTAFKEQNIRYALMGGFAIGLWGGARSTVDLDFLVDKDDMQKVHDILTSIEYKLYHHTENVSQYDSPLKVFGGIDFIHAFRKSGLEMLERAEDKQIFEGTFNIKTLIPEDLIGLKLQSLHNNPARESADIQDIETLVSICRKKMDRELLKSYFTLFDMNELYNRLFKEEVK